PGRLELADRGRDRLRVAPRIGEAVRAEVGKGGARREERPEGDDAGGRGRRARVGPSADEDLVREILGAPHVDAGEQIRGAAQAGVPSKPMGEAERREDEGDAPGERPGERLEAL